MVGFIQGFYLFIIYIVIIFLNNIWVRYCIGISYLVYN